MVMGPTVLPPLACLSNNCASNKGSWPRKWDGELIHATVKCAAWCLKGTIADPEAVCSCHIPDNQTVCVPLSSPINHRLLFPVSTAIFFFCSRTILRCVDKWLYFSLDAICDTFYKNRNMQSIHADIVSSVLSSCKS